MLLVNRFRDCRFRRIFLTCINKAFTSVSSVPFIIPCSKGGFPFAISRIPGLCIFMQKQCCQSVNFSSNIYFYHIIIQGVNHEGLLYRYMFSNVRHLSKGLILKESCFPTLENQLSFSFSFRVFLLCTLLSAAVHLAAGYSAAPLAESALVQSSSFFRIFSLS